VTVIVHAVAMPSVTVDTMVVRGLGSRAGTSALKTFFLRKIVHQSDSTRMGLPMHSVESAFGRSQLRSRQALKRPRPIARFALLCE
jgi:hypothetical protein